MSHAQCVRLDRPEIGACSGPPKYLPDEENEPEKFLMGCASVGYVCTVSSAGNSTRAGSCH